MNRIDKLAKEYVAPLLKKDGFKKKKLSWNRARGSFVDIIDIQELPGSTEDNERFVLNVGVFIPDYYETVWGQPYKGFAQEADAIFRTRLGDLLKEEFSEKINTPFIALDSDLDVLAVGEELSLAIGKKVLPCFDSFKNYRSLHDFIDSVDGWQKDYPLMQIYFALLKKSLGEKEPAIAILDGVIAGKNKAWAVHAQRIKTAI
jgi:hypothetical protein